MQENLKAKYGITDEEWKRATDQIQFGKIACDGMTICALVDLVANGDIAGAASKKIIFSSSEHEQFYKEQLAKCRYQDGYHKSLMYALGICDVTRNHFSEIYDFSTRCIKWECLSKDWITGTSGRVIRLAFNLFTGSTYEEDDEDKYTLSAIYGYTETKYLLQTIALKYEC